MICLQSHRGRGKSSINDVCVHHDGLEERPEIILLLIAQASNIRAFASAGRAMTKAKKGRLLNFPRKFQISEIGIQ